VVLPAETAPAATLTRRQKKLRTSPSSPPPLSLAHSETTPTNAPGKGGNNQNIEEEVENSETLPPSRLHIEVSSGSTALVINKRQCGAARLKRPLRQTLMHRQCMAQTRRKHPQNLHPLFPYEMQGKSQQLRTKAGHINNKPRSQRSQRGHAR